MANDCGFESVGALIDATVPPHIRKDGPLELGEFSEAFTEGQRVQRGLIGDESAGPDQFFRARSPSYWVSVKTRMLLFD